MHTLLQGAVMARCGPALPHPLLLLLLLSPLLAPALGECLLPTGWRGGWFQSGVREVISLSRGEFSSKGVCLQSSGEKFLFKDKRDDCYRCVVISEKHPNILQYKETLCEPTRDLDDLCSRITGDALLYSMFRRDAPPTPCPLKGPLTFSYSRGHGQCRQPVSTIDSCTSDSRLLFKYQACPDVHGTESSVEEVECIGHWKEGSTRYFVGRLEGRHALTDEDRYRCFAWERAREVEAHLDYRMAQSGDATCNGVFSAYDGSRILVISKAGSWQECVLPAWVREHRRWHGLDHGAAYTLGRHNTSLRLHHARPPPPPPARPLHAQPPHHHADGAEAVVGTTEARLVCVRQLESSSNHVMLLTHHTTGCSSGYMCTVLYRRDRHIIEMQQGQQVIRAGDACQAPHFNSSTATHATLTSSAPARRDCPLPGVWRTVGAGGECGDGEVTHLRAGCTHKHSLQFVHACASHTVTKHSLVCHGHWVEGDSMFVVASPLDRPTHRLCLVAAHTAPPPRHANASVAPAPAAHTRQLSGHTHSCPRRPVPPTHPLRLNLTMQGACAVTGSGEPASSPAPASPLLLLLLLLLSWGHWSSPL